MPAALPRPLSARSAKAARPTAGCGLKVTLTRQMTAGTISIRLFDYYCWHYNSVVSSGYCGASPYVAICSYSGSGISACTVPASAVGGKTIRSIVVHRAHGSGSTAKAKYLSIGPF